MKTQNCVVFLEFNRQMEKVLEYLNVLLYRIMNEREDDVKQKWIKLALLKSNLRSGLADFEDSLRCHVPAADRRKVLDGFYKLKDGIWQAIGALHGNLVSATIAVEVRLPWTLDK